MTVTFGNPRHAAFATLGTVIALLLACPQPALAQKGDSTPKPSVDCSLQKNKRKKECVNKHTLDDEELFHAGYWLARDGQYAEAISFLEHAKNPADPRILTYLGFAHRKLGHAETAMALYARALAADPNYTIARAYLGEAFLERGERERAAAELAAIESRCGTGCEEWRELADAMAKFDARRGRG